MKCDIILPCLNESATLVSCIKKAKQGIEETQKKFNVTGQIIIADNGSTDNSIYLAKDNGAYVVHIDLKGYGNALRQGIQKSDADYIIMADSDDSYDLRDIPLFIEQLELGFDLVMGNRFRGGIEKDAMPFMHKYVGNPVLSNIGKLLYTNKCSDFHCGMRGFRRSAIMELNLQSPGMEFASEMIIKASKHKLKITEIPIKLYKDGRGRKSHLRTYRDGMRHLHMLIKHIV